MLHSRKGERYSLIHRVQQHILADVLHRLRSLAKLRLLPAMYGPDISAAMQQKYTGDVTIVPRVGGPYAIIKMVQNPSKAMMTRYIEEGQRAAFSRLAHVKHLLALEQALDVGLQALLGARKHRDAQGGRRPPPWAAVGPEGSLGAKGGLASADLHRARSSAWLPGSSTAPAPPLRRSLSLPSASARHNLAGQVPLREPPPPDDSSCGPGVPRLSTSPTPAAPPVAQHGGSSHRWPEPSRPDSRGHRRSISHNSLELSPSLTSASRSSREARLFSPQLLLPPATSPPADALDGDAPSPTSRLPPAGCGSRALSPSTVGGEHDGRDGVTPNGHHNGQLAEHERWGGADGERWSSTDRDSGTHDLIGHHDDTRSKMLLSQSVKHTKALQQLSRDKVALQKTLTEHSDMLRTSEDARERAERRVVELEAALQTVQKLAESAAPRLR